MGKDSQIQTFKGHHFDFEDLESNVIDIVDVAHSLSMQPRWTGHVKHRYSVAQHSFYCYLKAAELYPERLDIQFEALMHDGSEYVMVDLSRPLKKMLPDYSALQLRVEKLFANQFGIPEIMSPEVREIDDGMLITEYIQLFNDFTHPNLTNFYLKPYDYILHEWDHHHAKGIFLYTYEDLKSRM